MAFLPVVPNRGQQGLGISDISLAVLDVYSRLATGETCFFF